MVDINMRIKYLSTFFISAMLFSTTTFADLQKGIDAANIGDFETAKAEFEYLAQNNYAPGIYYLADLYANGHGVARDYNQAVLLYEQAVKLGYEDAMFALAVLYQDGKGVKVDSSKAAELFTQAAKKGVVAAQFNLGVLYTNGIGVAKDYELAIDWYTKAAAQNYTLAQFNLALMHFEGLGTPKSISKSYIWNTIAEFNGNKDASQSRKLDERKLSPSEIKLAKEKAEEIYQQIVAGKYVDGRRI
ncbi:putative secreted protein with protein prenylyltransferase domain [Pseudoalteromonas tunicata D2]|jgi:TPR repeat protein|uniref:Putative secreted protein with protein prenylyltransferase domain n=2 Tax=Pseudoalteromonas tunicata TaxID=314281 RepID=A4C4P6_9GAMM|nr:putative secreted protein with protein prenylyltransferase domain [Pseudoalteromonas tunicata D2]